MIDIETANSLRIMLIEMHEGDFRAGFEDSVLLRCRKLIAKLEGERVAREFWSNANLPGGDSFLRMFFGAGTYDVFMRVKANENKEGAFVMPSWGTSGT